jgi:hypothetical protein
MSVSALSLSSQEGVNLLRERHALGADHARLLLELMRVEGVRRVNVHKNTTKALYAFNGAWFGTRAFPFAHRTHLSGVSLFQRALVYLQRIIVRLNPHSSATLNASQRVSVPRLRVRQGGVLRRSVSNFIYVTLVFLDFFAFV